MRQHHQLLIVSSVLLLSAFPAGAQSKAQAPAPRTDLLRVAQQQLAAGNNDVAIEALNELLRRGGNNLQARRLMIYALENKGDFTNAGRHLTALFKVTQPTYYDWYYLGRVYAAQNQSAQAVNCFKKALDQNPKMELAKIETIKVLLAQNKVDEASELCSEGYHGTTDPRLLDQYSTLYSQISDARANPNRRPVPTASRPTQPGEPATQGMQQAPTDANPVAPFSQPGQTGQVGTPPKLPPTTTSADRPAG